MTARTPQEIFNSRGKALLAEDVDAVGDVLFLEWSADSDANGAEHSVDTFIFRDGLIQAQTVCYTLTPHS